MRWLRTLAVLGVAAAVVLVPTPRPAGAASADVAALQVALRAVGFSPGPIDGISGPWTRRAVRRFQSRRHLVVDGIAGPQTRRALGRRGGPRLGSRTIRIGQRG